MKKILAIVLALGMLSSNASAITIDSRKNEVSVSGTTQRALHPVFLIAPKVTFEEAANDAQNIIFADVLTAEGNTFKVTIPMKKIKKSGVYTLISADEKYNIYYATEADKLTCINTFKGNNYDEINLIIDDKNNYFCLLGSKSEFYEKFYVPLSLKARKKVAQLLAGFVVSSTENIVYINNAIDNFNMRFEEVCAEVYKEYGFETIKPLLADGDTKKVLEDYAEMLDLDIKRLSSEEESEQALIYDTIKETLLNAETLTNSQLTQICYRQAALAKINSKTKRTSGFIRDIINDYNDVLEIDLTDGNFARLSNTKQQEVLSSLSEKKYATAKELADAIDELSKEASEEKKGSNSSGGGSSKRNYISTAVGAVVNNVNNKTANAEENIKFYDLTGFEWAQNAIYALCEKGIVNGMESGKYMPLANVTREQFVKMLVMLFGFDVHNDENSFSDVIKGSWYVQYVNSAKSNGIINGKSDNIFGVGESITRQDMAVMMTNAAEKAGITFAESTEYFGDDESINPYAKKAVYKLKESGVISGRGNNFFEPLENATRAEAAVMLYRIMKIKEVSK